MSNVRAIFRVRGRVVDAEGTPARAFIAVVDADPDLDDLIAVGTSEPDGSFRVSFTTEAFNQEPGEAEQRPDLYVVLSTLDEGKPVPVLRRDFGKLAFASAGMEEDLGTLVLPKRGGDSLYYSHLGLATTTPLRSAPGRGKIVKRLRLDEELVEIAAREVAPHVEHLTGWSRLLEGVRFEIVDSWHDVYRARVEALLGRSDFGADELARFEVIARGCDASSVANWDPYKSVVRLNRSVLEAQSFDYLKLTLGHELVHAGQSRARPDQDKWLQEKEAETWKHLLAGTEETIEAQREVMQFMANCEGYAFYIEQTFLSRIYTHGAQLAQVTNKADQRFRYWEARRTLPEAPAKTKDAAIERVEWTKSAQYTAGCAAYLARTKDGRAVPFDGDLRPDVEPLFLELANLLVTLETARTK